MKFGIVGMGPVGTALGDKFMTSGHEVKYGARDPTSDKTKDALAARPNGATVDTVQNAVTWGEIVIFAISGVREDDAIAEAGKSLGDGVAGKLVVDTTNSCSADPDMSIRWTHGTSVAEELQKALPTAKVAKIFNTVGASLMVSPDGSDINGKQLRMLYACDPSVKDTAEAVTVAAGWDPMYMGPLRYSRNLEAFAEMWIHLAVLNVNGENPAPNFHFQYISDKKP